MSDWRVDLTSSFSGAAALGEIDAWSLLATTLGGKTKPPRAIVEAMMFSPSSAGPAASPSSSTVSLAPQELIHHRVRGGDGHMAKRICGNCNKMVLSKNFKRHLDVCAANVEDEDLEEVRSSPAAKRPALVTPPPSEAVQPRSSAAQSAAPRASTMDLRSIKFQADDGSFLAKYFASMTTARARVASQVQQEMARITKFLSKFAAPDLSDEQILERQHEILSSKKNLDDFGGYLASRNIKNINNWYQELAIYMDFVRDNDPRLREHERNALMTAASHARNCGKGQKRRDSAAKLERNSREALEQANRWATWDELKQLLRDYRPEFERIVFQCKLDLEESVSPRELKNATTFAMMASLVDCTASRGGELPSLLLGPIEALLASDDEVKLINVAAFKTKANYGYKMFQLTPWVVKLWEDYITCIRPAVLAYAGAADPPCDRLFVNMAGNPVNSFGTWVREFTAERTGGKIQLSPTIIRKLEETATVERNAAVDDLSAIRRNRAHMDSTAQAYYLKTKAKETATKAADAHRRVLGSIFDKSEADTSAMAAEDGNEPSFIEVEELGGDTVQGPSLPPADDD